MNHDHSAPPLRCSIDPLSLGLIGLGLAGGVGASAAMSGGGGGKAPDPATPPPPTPEAPPSMNPIPRRATGMGTRPTFLGSIGMPNATPSNTSPGKSLLGQ